MIRVTFTNVTLAIVWGGVYRAIGYICYILSFCKCNTTHYMVRGLQRFVTLLH